MLRKRYTYIIIFHHSLVVLSYKERALQQQYSLQEKKKKINDQRCDKLSLVQESFLLDFINAFLIAFSDLMVE